MKKFLIALLLLVFVAPVEAIEPEEIFNLYVSSISVKKKPTVIEKVEQTEPVSTSTPVSVGTPYKSGYGYSTVSYSTNGGCNGQQSYSYPQSYSYGTTSQYSYGSVPSYSYYAVPSYSYRNIPTYSYASYAPALSYGSYSIGGSYRQGPFQSSAACLTTN